MHIRLELKQYLDKANTQQNLPLTLKKSPNCVWVVGLVNVYIKESGAEAAFEQCAGASTRKHGRG